MSAEILTLLNAKTTRFDTGSGGVPSVTQSDIASALGQLNGFQSLLLRLKFAGQTELTVRFVLEVGIKVLQWSVDEDWKAHGSMKLKDPVIAITREAVAEWLSCKCRTCKGTGEVKVLGGKVVTCKKCDGTGDRPKSTYARAKACKISDHAFADVWKDRYERILELLNREEAQAADDLRRALK